MKVLIDARLCDGEHITTVEPIEVEDATEYKREISRALDNERFLEIPISKNRCVSIKVDRIDFVFYEVIFPDPEESDMSDSRKNQEEEARMKAKLAEEEIKESLKQGRSGIEMLDQKKVK